MNNYILLNSLISIILISGCSNKTEPEPEYSDIDKIVFSKPELVSSDFEKEMIRVSAKAERHWKNYYSLLEKRKELENPNMKHHIPYGMGKRISIDYEGRLGDFLKLLAQKTGYSFEYQNITVQDTPMLAKSYYRTTAYDVVKDIMDQYDFDIKIIENEQLIILSSKV